MDERPSRGLGQSNLRSRFPAPWFDSLPTSPFQGEEFVAGLTEAATSEQR